MIKLLLAYSFQKMLLIGQSSKHVHMTYSFLELLIFFLFNSSTYLLFKVYFYLCKYILQRKPHEIKTNRYTFLLASDIDIEKSFFFNIALKFMINNFQFFSVS